MWIPVAFTKDPIVLIALISIQAFLSAISVPAWTVALMKSIPNYQRGEISGRFNAIGGLGSFIGTLIGGYIVFTYGFTFFLFFMIFFFGLLSRLPFLFVKLPTMTTYSSSFKSALKKTFDFHSVIKEKKLMSLIKTIAFLNFAVSLAGPFFSVYVIQQLGGSRLDVAIIAAIGALAGSLFFSTWGKLVDYLGRKTVMLGCIIPITFIPFVYIISNNVYWIYLYTVVANMSWAGFNLAAFAYLSDVVPSERSSYYVSIYNFLTGLSTAVAPFVGGIIADLTSIAFVFLLSTVLRVCTFYFLDRLEEKTGTRPTGILNLKFDYFGLSNRLETFVMTYSLAMYDFRKRSKDFMDLGKYVRTIKLTTQNNIEKMKKKKGLKV
jgi:MFS family permease